MGTITAQKICDRASTALFDLTKTRWSDPELLAYLSEGQMEAVVLRPSANARNTVLQLVAGSKQTIPADGLAFGYGVRNMGVDGATPGRAVREVPRAILDSTRPNWHTHRPKQAVLHWVHDTRDPRHFYVVPPQTAVPAQLEIVYYKAPAELTDITAAIELDDAYQTALLYYVLARALAKDADGSSVSTAQGYYQMFVNILTGGEAAVDQVFPTQRQERTRK